MNLKNKVALITGGARIGRVVAEALAAQGCHIAMTYRRSKKGILSMRKICQRRKRRFAAVATDLLDEGSVHSIVPTVLKELGRLDILVNMASLYAKTPLAQLEAWAAKPKGAALEAAWSRQMNTDLRSTFWLSLQAAQAMKKKGAGRIINFTDWVAASGRPRYKEYIPYYTAKVGVKGLTEILALELAPEILVNVIAPGPILAPPDITQREENEVLRATPLQKWGGPEEIAKTVVFLCQSDFITGECLRVDGGRHLR